MLVLFSVAFYLKELDFYMSNHSNIKREFSELSFILAGEAEI